MLEERWNGLLETTTDILRDLQNSKRFSYANTACKVDDSVTDEWLTILVVHKITSDKSVLFF
jgi:hypothetical protein